MSEEIVKLLEDMVSDSEEDEDFTNYPAVLIIWKDNGPVVQMNQWQKIGARQLEKAMSYVLSERHRQKVKTMREDAKQEAKTKSKSKTKGAK